MRDLCLFSTIHIDNTPLNVFMLYLTEEGYAMSADRQRMKNGKTIKLTPELDEHLDRVVAAVEENHSLKNMLHYTPTNLLSVEREPKRERSLKVQIIEFLILNHINDFTQQFTPNVEPFHPYDDGETAVDRGHAHLINRDRALIEQAIIDHPDILDALPKDPRELPDKNHMEICFYAGFIRSLKLPKNPR